MIDFVDLYVYAYVNIRLSSEIGWNPWNNAVNINFQLLFRSIKLLCTTPRNLFPQSRMPWHRAAKPIIFTLMRNSRTFVEWGDAILRSSRIPPSRNDNATKNVFDHCSTSNWKIIPWNKSTRQSAISSFCFLIFIFSIRKITLARYITRKLWFKP